MGLLASVAQGIGEGAKAAQPYILQMQSADIQKIRDERMAEVAKQAQERGFAHADQTLGKTQQFTQVENEATRQNAREIADDATVRDELQHGERMTQSTQQHTERMAALEKAAANQAAQIGLEGRKLALLENVNALDVKQKTAIEKARDNYTQEKDPEKRIELGNTYLTLIGKVGERYKAIESVDPVTGAKTVTGFFDQSSARVLGPGGVTGKATGGAQAQFKASTGEVRVNGQIIPGTAKTQAEADALARQFIAKAPPAAAAPAPAKADGLLTSPAAPSAQPTGNAASPLGRAADAVTGAATDAIEAAASAHASAAAKTAANIALKKKVDTKQPLTAGERQRAIDIGWIKE